MTIVSLNYDYILEPQYIKHFDSIAECLNLPFEIFEITPRNSEEDMFIKEFDALNFACSDDPNLYHLWLERNTKKIKK